MMLSNHRLQLSNVKKCGAQLKRERERRLENLDGW